MTHYQSDFFLLHGSFGSIRGNLFCVVGVSGGGPLWHLTPKTCN